MENTKNLNSGIQLNVYSNQSAYPDQYVLRDGETLFAGNAVSCSIPLVGPDVAQFHCMFELCDGQVLVQNCQPDEKTFVNDVEIGNEAVCQLEDTISVGSCKIILAPHETDAEDRIDVVQSAVFDEKSIGDWPDENPSECLPIATESADAEPAILLSPPADLSEGRVLDSDHDAEFAETIEDADDVSRSATKYEAADEPADKQTNWWDQQPDDFVDLDQHEPAWPGETVDFCAENSETNVTDTSHDEIEMLRAEIEILHSDVFAKDEEIAHLKSASLEPNAADATSSERLVVRLEELLEELQAADERVRSLEDLLKTSDEANRAEQAERKQIEEWLSEVENRVAAREAEFDAEIQSLKRQLGYSQQQHQKAEAQLKKWASNRVETEKPTTSKPETVPPPARIESGELTQLKQTVTQLERLLESANSEKSAAERKANELQRSAKADVSKIEALEQKMVEVELAASRERAEVARQRMELEIKLEQVQRENGPRTELNESDFRFAAMRDHLREIHEEEKVMKRQQQESSLTGRIARLLKRK